MVKLSTMKQDDLEVVAYFLARINSIEESHIGFCGTDSTEIAESIEEISYMDCFFTAYDGAELVGVIGFDPDYDSGDAEIWGPFIEGDDEHILYELWNTMTEKLPIEIQTLHLFPNKKNKKVIDLAKFQLFKRGNNQAILVFHRDNRHLVQDATVEEISQNFFKAMETLHDNTFPNTYYSGKQILDKIDEHHQVFVFTENQELFGYIYVEAEPKHGEASIEFFGVHPDKRGKGIGGKLLASALKWLFSFKTIESITLCVDSSNDRAIHLYEKVGFELKYDMHYFVKKI